jgi:class 3 adenylate cyclase
MRPLVHIAQLLGDGLLVYFGYPAAHEDDAQRAVRAGLGILAAVEALNTRLELAKGITLAVRLGIHTGLVVVGAMGGAGRQEQLALGEVPNIASRIQGLADKPRQHLCYVYASLSRLDFRDLSEKGDVVFEGFIGFPTVKKPTALRMHW